MIHSRSLTGNSHAAQAQWRDVVTARHGAELQENLFFNAGQLATNDGFVPRDVYQEFDRVTVERMRSDDGDTFLNDLMPLSRPVSIGTLLHKFRRASDAGSAQSSMQGQVGPRLEQVEYNYDGSIVPVSDTGFYRGWREWPAMRSEGFDALIDDSREHTATLRRHLADAFLDGYSDNSGNLIVVDSTSWAGMRNDSRVAQVDLGAGGVNFDFTDTGGTGDANKNAFIEVRNVLWIDNNCGLDAVYYVSREIAANWERKFSTSYDSKTILDELKGLAGVADIKVSSKLSGNELMAFPLDADAVRPITGMGVNTVALPRPLYNSNYEFIVWAAIGWEVRTDFSGNTCAMFAQE